MKLLVALLLVTPAILAFAPAPDARPYCVVGHSECRGNLVCAYPHFIPIDRVCVADPCHTTACFATLVKDDLVEGTYLA